MTEAVKVGNKFDQIDGLRFFAILGVIFVHWRWSGSDACQSIATGSLGVDLFFVISGFLITLGLIRSKAKSQSTNTTLYHFYIRRFLRIFPIYYLTLFILLLFHYSELSEVIWWYVLYLSNFYNIYIKDWGLAGHFWSLSVEEQFYLVWPFVILFLPNKKLPLAVVASVFLSLAFKSYWFVTGKSFWWLYMHPIASLDSLALGGLLAYLYLFHNDRLKAALFNSYLIFLVTAQMIFFVLIRTSPSLGFLHHIGIRASFGLFCMWLIGRATFGFTGIVGLLLDSRPLKYIGKISYSIYLFHPFVPQMRLGFVHTLDYNLRFLIYSIITLLLSSISWYLFESRILVLKKYFE